MAKRTTTTASNSRFAISNLKFSLLVVSAAVAWLGVDRASAQSTTSPPSAAARLRLIAEEPQPQVQVTTEQPRPLTDEPPLRAPVGPPANDPTVPNGALRDLLGNETPKSAGSTPSMPDIRLRARIVVHGKPPTALVEIGGGVRRQAQTGGDSPPGHPSVGLFRTIREGEEFVVPQGDSVSPVRVVKLSATEVLLEIINRKTMIRLD